MKIGFATFAAFIVMLNSAALHADGGDTTLIHACVAKDGVMRIVSATSACKSNETALHWATAARVSAIEAKNAAQDSVDASLTSATSAIQTKNSSQDAAIAALQSATDVPSGAVIQPPKAPYVFGNRVNVSFDSTHTVYDTDSYVGTNQFVIPQSGIYLLNLFGVNAAEGSFLALFYSVNGNLQQSCLSIGTTGAYPLCNGSELLNLNAGDTITFAIYPSSDNVTFLRFGISKQ